MYSLQLATSLPRWRRVSRSITKLWQAKRAIFRSSNGTIIEKKFTTNKSLREFYESNNVVSLIDEATNQASVRPNLTTLVQGANYTFVTIAEALLQASLAKMRVQDVGARETAPPSSKAKIISCRTGDGESFKAIVANSRSFKELLASNSAAYAVDENNRRVYDYDGIENGGSYRLEGKVLAKAKASPGQATTPQREFDYDQLPLPAKILPLIPAHDDSPGKYICPSDYRQSVLDTIYYNLAAREGSRRVPPLALVGCIQSGKTATLEQLALAIS